MSGSNRNHYAILTHFFNKEYPKMPKAAMDDEKNLEKLNAMIKDKITIERFAFFPPENRLKHPEA